MSSSGVQNTYQRGYYRGCYTDYYLNAWKVNVWAISQEEFDKKEKAAGQSDQLPS